MGLETKNTEIQLIDDDPVIVVDEEEKQPLKIDENQPGMINEKDQKVDANQQESINEKVQPVEIVDIEIDDTVDVNQPGLINKNDQQVGPNQSAINEKDQIDTPMVELIEDDVDLVEDNNDQKNNEINNVIDTYISPSGRVKKHDTGNSIDNGKNNEIEPIEIIDEPINSIEKNESTGKNSEKNNETQLIVIGDEPIEINDDDDSSKNNSENDYPIEILDQSIENVTVDFIGKKFKKCLIKNKIGLQ